MKKTIFLMFAISILFCSSVSAYAVEHSHDNDIRNISIILSNATEEQHNFFYEWNNTPSSEKFIASTCLDNGGLPPCNNILFHFFILQKPYNNNFRLNLNKAYSDKTRIEITSGLKFLRLSSRLTSISPNIKISSFLTPQMVDFSNSSFSFSHYHSSASMSFSTSGYTDYDWNKDTPLDITYDVDITKPWEDPTIPPSSSSEPPPPPVFPDIDIPSGPTELPPIEIPEVDRPVIVPPYDDEYIWYDPSAWEDFFNNINLNIGKVVNAAIIILALIYSIILVIKVIKYFVRGDDIFDDWQL